jgi:hypothetical protein
MEKVEYSSEFKKVAVQKYLSNRTGNLRDLASELGVSHTCLWKWVGEYKKYANSNGMNHIDKRPQDWTADEKIQACFDYENLSVEQQGEFLRRKGLHSDRLVEWKNLCLSALSLKGNDAASRVELNDANRKIKELERDLNRKDKALAEASALLVLKKKADLIWGNEDLK